MDIRHIMGRQRKMINMIGICQVWNTGNRADWRVESGLWDCFWTDEADLARVILRFRGRVGYALVLGTGVSGPLTPVSS